MFPILALCSFVYLVAAVQAGASPLFASLDSFTQSYYVATNGSDSNPGTLSQPWRTIQKAAATLVAGEKVYIRGGTYGEQVIPRNSGGEGKPISYLAYPGETVTIDGTNVILPEWDGLVTIVNKGFIQISGLHILNAGPNPHNLGILTEESSYITIDNNFISRTNDSGIGVWRSDHITVTNNEVEQACLAGFNESISIGGTDIFEVSRNRVHRGPKEGICLKDGSSNGKAFGNEAFDLDNVGIYVDAWDKHTYNIEVFQNLVHNIRDDGLALASEMGGLLENVYLYNNLSFNNRSVGINISQNGDSATHPMQNISLVNNTIVGNGMEGWGGGIAIDSKEVANTVVGNNVVSQNLSFQIVLNPGVPPGRATIDTNLIYGFRDSEGETLGVNCVEADPRFVSPEMADFFPKPDSPVINAGRNEALPPGVITDLAGNPRIVGGTVDLGAYEFVPIVPLVTTDPVIAVTQCTASSGGEVRAEGGAPVTARGVCWSISSNPTVTDSITLDGSGMGRFTSSLVGLSAGTLYHLRAYATNSLGTGYGKDLSFRTSASVVFYVNKNDASCGGNDPCCSSIQAAVNAAPDGALIKITGGNYNESLILNSAKCLTLEGRFLPSYAGKTSTPTVVEGFSAPSGVLRALDMRVKP